MDGFPKSQRAWSLVLLTGFSRNHSESRMIGPQSFCLALAVPTYSLLYQILLGLQSHLGTRGLFKPEPLEKNQGCLFLRAFVHPLTNRRLWQKGSGLHMSNMCFREFWPAMRACSEHVIRVQRCCVSKKVRGSHLFSTFAKTDKYSNGEIFCQYDLQQTDFGAGHYMSIVFWC